MAKPIPEHPIEPRIYHWIHLISMGCLGFTGLYIYWPFFQAPMKWMQFTHYVAMYVILAVLILRISYAILHRRRDWHEFGLGLKQWKMLPHYIGYYIFIKKEHHKDVGAYNPMQRLTYIFFGLLLIPQAITGFALYPSTASYFTWLTSLMGGAAYVRSLHFFIMWIFAIVAAVHIYMAVFEEFSQFKYMILNIAPKEIKK